MVNDGLICSSVGKTQIKSRTY